MDNQKTGTEGCRAFIRAIHDVMDLLHGKWKIYIIASLYYEKKRYSDILKDLDGISGKMLSKELREMEQDKLITRTVATEMPVMVVYELTEYGQSLKPTIEHLAAWGINHRKEIQSIP